MARRSNVTDFLTNFNAGMQLGRNVRQGLDLAKIARERPEELADSYSDEQGAMLSDADARGANVRYDQNEGAYTIDDGGQAAQIVRPQRVTNFLGERVAGTLTPEQIRARRAQASADVVARYDPEAAMRMQREAAGLSILPEKTEAERTGARLQTATNNATMAVLPDATQAKQTGFQLDAAQNRAGLGLAGLNASNDRKEAELRGAGLDAQKARQPMEDAVRYTQANVEKVLAEAKMGELPGAVARLHAEGAMSTSDAAIAAGARLYDYINANDGRGAISFVNQMAQTGIIPGLPKTGVASVEAAEDKEHGKVVQFKDKAGNVLYSLSARNLQQFKALAAGSKAADYKTVRPGETLVQTGDGGAQAVYTAPETDGSRAAKMGPLERDVNYLVERFGMSPERALAQLNSAKTMSREQFILKSVNDMVAMGKPASDADVVAFGRLYDSAQNAPRTDPQATPATQGNPDWQSWLK